MAAQTRSGTASANRAPAESLRERRRRQTTDEISAVALRLFDARGFSETTVDDIASEAGVSRATFFRYFRSKEEAALHELIDLSGAMDRRSRASSAVAPTLPALTECTADLLARVTPQQMAHYAVLRKLIEREDALRQAADAHAHALAERIRSRLLATEQGHDRLATRVLAETTVALLQATLDEWVDSPESDLVALYRDAVERLRRCAAHP
ncbi:TetR family transcriptional regulator [Kineosporia sp. NBRC 101731]|uniref:TetR family transcriptional regulator n=1 Tax=Kineosporia sp. NBRC 101731 TaxID=3032199 RepID=UPI0024A0192F|nr:TetR family transcriptional regulator [Kineosporia sp. NBRC 101731]GLY32201.1 TetR family transcriptional regulator [Kineosporia sp. NBRC 101731]